MAFPGSALIESTGNDRDKTVTEPLVLKWLGLASSEKQIPQVVVFVRNQRSRMELLEAIPLRPRQVRYQAALRPDFYLLDSKTL